jgi:hypothetical protein
MTYCCFAVSNGIALSFFGGGPNVEKQAKLPADWPITTFSSADQGAMYIHGNDLRRAARL